LSHTFSSLDELGELLLELEPLAAASLQQKDYIT
jgi:hypothetical protein